MENHGTDPKTRWRLLREQIQAMKAIWTNDEAEYHGHFVSFDPIWSWPKPVQKPHPPILMGGNGPTTLQRIVEYCDEWFPIVGRGHPLEERIPELQRLAAEAGRGTIPVSIFNAPNDPKEIERFEKIGVTRCVFGLPSAGSNEVVPLIGRLAETAKSFR
jgi:alkanesulfonate monooxygenase SsuD/methylene tetrahydromethanopterin reductase-like flavin-dependent oxidoreductase (luciferase family)